MLRALALMASLIAFAVASEPASAAIGGPPPYADWRVCADEGGTCTGLGRPEAPTAQVRYGDYHLPWADQGFGNWSIQVRSISVPCNNTWFGDPFPNRTKHCERDVSNWIYCAVEGEICTVPAGGKKWIRYGASDPWASGPHTEVEVGWLITEVDRSFRCANSTFNSDPHRNVVKACYIYGGTW
jgi:hypothetical protein